MRYQGRLLAHLKNDSYEPATIAAVADELRVEDPAAFEAEVRAMAAQGLLELDARDVLRLPSLKSLGEELVGRIKVTQKGFAFVTPEALVREGDVFIPKGETADALSGDIVRIGFERDAKREQRGEPGPSYRGWVLEVIERKRGCFTGEVYKQGSTWLVHPDGKEMAEPIVVRDAEAKNVKPGDKVVVDIVEYPEDGQLAEGVISRVLGDAGRPDVETEAVIAAYGLPGEFPEACLEQAREASRAFDEEIAEWERRGAAALTRREDRTAEFIITIDPPDAKDYDDAISIRRVKDGWELGVFIADVAHFIPPGSPLDAEAEKRGNSVYLPRLVIPMLPEVLSNGICSLQEGAPRFVKAAYMRYDRDGNRIAEGVGQALIVSRKRLTYLEAQALIDGDPEEARKHAKTEPNYTPELLDALREMNRLAIAIRGRRERRGMISLELPDVDLVFDEQGHVIDAVPEDDVFTHTLIEMFMVDANEVLARLFEDMDVPLLRRTHPEPTPGDADNLRVAAKVAGFTIPKSPTREELQGLLNATRGTPQARAIHMAVLRTLTKATYSPALVGHFALASDAYAHFTSPIRRYPDLTVHRALAAYLEATDNGRERPQGDHAKRGLGRELRDDRRCLPMEELVRIGRHCTMTEENAAEAERELRNFLVLQVLAEKHLDEDHDGVVTGVSPRGVYVQLSKYLAEGMVKTDDLPGDTTRDNRPPRWKLDRNTNALVDLNSGRSFAAGHLVRVRILSIDLAKRQMDLLLADSGSRAAGKTSKAMGGKGVAGLTLGQGGGGLASNGGAGFRPDRTGAQRRSAKSKARDKRKPDHRREK